MRSDERKPFTTLANDWRREAAGRKSRTTTDQGADALESCARELDALVEQVEKDGEMLTPQQFAEAHGLKAQQTVTRWCRLELIVAERGPNGWMIPAGTKPPLLRGSHRTG